MWKDSLCEGCGNPRDESFNPVNEERYDAVAWTCFACAERQRVSHKMAGHDVATLPPQGIYIAMSGPD